MLELVERPVLDCKGSDGGVPWLYRISLLNPNPQIKKQVIKIRGLDRALCAVFWGVFNIVEILDHLASGLRDGNNAGNNAERIYSLVSCGEGRQ